jgi:tetratricopeptide (TPR) repeat protein
MNTTTTPLPTPSELVHFPDALEQTRTAAISPQARHCFQEGVTRLQSGDAAAAVAALSRSVEYAPGFSDAHVFLGIAYSLTYNIYPAVDHLEEAGRLAPDSFAAHYTLALLNFKLRVPRRGYEVAQQALRCVQTLEQRKMLTQLLKEERQLERNGIPRPSFDKPFSKVALCVGGSAVATLVLVALALMR